MVIQLGRKVLTSLILIAALPSESYSDGFSILSDANQLKSQLIVDVGGIREVEPPANTQWRDQVFQMNGRCFTMPGYFGYWGYGEKAGLILVDEAKVVRVALLKSGIGSIDVDVQVINLIGCP